MSKAENKFDNFSKAVKRLNEANIYYKKFPDNEMFQDALIKRFEFTFELAWKSLREFLQELGYRLESASPKGVFAFAYQERYLNDEEIWLDMLTDRNLTAHDYGRELAAGISDKISTKYCKALTELSKLIAKHLN